MSCWTTKFCPLQRDRRDLPGTEKSLTETRRIKLVACTGRSKCAFEDILRRQITPNECRNGLLAAEFDPATALKCVAKYAKSLTKSQKHCFLSQKTPQLRRKKAVLNANFRAIRRLSDSLNVRKRLHNGENRRPKVQNCVHQMALSSLPK